MTTKEIIEHLKKCNPELEAVVEIVVDGITHVVDIESVFDDDALRFLNTNQCMAPSTFILTYECSNNAKGDK